MDYSLLWVIHYYLSLSISTHLYELLSLAIQCYGHYALLRSMDRVDTFPDVQDVSRICQAVARSDLSQKITLSVKGNVMIQLKEVINTMVRLAFLIA